jgi:hypothetical protein
LVKVIEPQRYGLGNQRALSASSPILVALGRLCRIPSQVELHYNMGRAGLDVPNLSVLDHVLELFQLNRFLRSLLSRSQNQRSPTAHALQSNAIVSCGLIGGAHLE